MRIFERMTSRNKRGGCGAQKWLEISTVWRRQKKKAELKRTQKIKPMKDVMKDVNCFVKNILYP